MPEIQIGDVCLDLAQGRPVHVVDSYEEEAAAWSDANGYDLLENYGNARLGAEPTDRVLDVVYCSSAKSEPSKSYAMPESRLLRVETEAADDGRPVRDRITRLVLERLFVAAFDDDGDEGRVSTTVDVLARDQFDESLVDEAIELADVERRFDANGGSKDD